MHHNSKKLQWIRIFSFVLPLGRDGGSRSPPSNIPIACKASTHCKKQVAKPTWLSVRELDMFTVTLQKNLFRNELAPKDLQSANNRVKNASPLSQEFGS